MIAVGKRPPLKVRLLCLFLGHQWVDRSPPPPDLDVTKLDSAKNMRALQEWALAPVRLECTRCGRSVS